MAAQGSTTAHGGAPAGSPAHAEPDDDAGETFALERATWRLSERRYVGPDESAALALIEAWRKMP